MLLTADHGNSEVMVNPDTGKPQTAHTTNKVPFVLINAPKDMKLKDDGALCNIAPTVLQLMGIPKPVEMDCDSLIKQITLDRCLKIASVCLKQLDWKLMADIKNLDIDFSFKKNNVDELFFNLSENPEGFKNKDFRYTLSLIYQTVEDEFAGVFLSPNAPARNTNFYLVNNNDKLSFFVTPTNNFQYYLKFLLKYQQNQRVFLVLYF